MQKNLVIFKTKKNPPLSTPRRKKGETAGNPATQKEVFLIRPRTDLIPGGEEHLNNKNGKKRKKKRKHRKRQKGVSSRTLAKTARSHTKKKKSV